MPPHCDTLDGPVALAAKRALDDGDVKIILPFAPVPSRERGSGAFQEAVHLR